MENKLVVARGQRWCRVGVRVTVKGWDEGHLCGNGLVLYLDRSLGIYDFNKMTQNNVDTLNECDIADFDIVLQLCKMEPLGKLGDGYLRPLCIISATAC